MSKIPQHSALIVCLFVLSILLGGGAMLATNSAMISGVPVSIIVDFLADETARNAYFKRDRRGLHDRLQAMGVEEEIKAFYRPKIRDEVKLDQYIHQIFYNNVGYVGDRYYVNSQGTLTLKQSVSDDFKQWFKLAYEAGVVTGSRQENGIQYVISPQGKVAPYKDIAAAIPLEMLRPLAEMNRQKIKAPPDNVVGRGSSFNP